MSSFFYRLSPGRVLASKPLRWSVLIALAPFSLLAGCGSSSSGGPTNLAEVQSTKGVQPFICALDSVKFAQETQAKALVASRTTATPTPAPTLPPSPPGVPPLRLVPLQDGYLEGTPRWPEGMTTNGGNGKTLTTPSGQLTCAPMVLNWHNHGHLTIILDGQQIALPSSIGIYKPVYQYKDIWPDTYITSTNGGCMYGIHVHDRSGKIHVEGPKPTRYTLGDLFKLWGQPLSRTQIADIQRSDIQFIWKNNDTTPAVIWKTDPTDIPFWRHTEVTIIIGKAPATIPTYNYFGKD